MFKLSVLFLFFRTIPEGILLIFANYVIVNKPIDKNLVISGVLLGCTIYIIRFLPIHFGVHTCIVLCAYILLSTLSNKIAFYIGLKFCILWLSILSLLDISLFYIYINLLHIKSNILLRDDFISLLLGMPSLTLFAIVLLILHMKNLQKIYRKGKI